MKKYVVLEKPVGLTPLECAEAWRATAGEEYQNVPLAYAGRLDPMASGKLLVLIGDECKRQRNYHGLDKGYDFSILLGVKTDTADVLGIIEQMETPDIHERNIKQTLQTLAGDVALPYPHFSAKTVQGKPLHTWAVEGRLDEITIPTNHAYIYSLLLTRTETKTGQAIYDEVSQKIETVTPVTDPRKALGNDFRRPEVRAGWRKFVEQHAKDEFTIAHCHCVAASGAYMRSLAEAVSEKLGTVGLAYSIHRTDIGQYQSLPFVGGGFWLQRYKS